MGVLYIPDDATEDEVDDMATWQWCRAFEEHAQRLHPDSAASSPTAYRRITV